MTIKCTQTPAHFHLDNESAYQAWRNSKLFCYETGYQSSAIKIANINQLTAHEHARIKQQIRQYNIAFYRLCNANKNQAAVPGKLASQLGLLKPDKHLCGDDSGLSQIKVRKKRSIGEYIPYTNHAINWHTDGYYNSDDKKIHSMILHCESSAMVGGNNAFIDHELIYILLRDENPDYIRALSHKDTMLIPENRQHNILIRPKQSGPVFSFCPWGLHMRYTARTKSIAWRDDVVTQRAVERIREIHNDDSIYKIKHRLQPGEGVVSNNILHMRTGFTDNENKRLLYRIRFYQPLLLNDSGFEL